jgi:hypothetical protein
MQNRYSGDIGDYIKLALLRHIGHGRELGVAWYLHPDQHHNDDGKHVAYLKDTQNWKHLDPDLFDALDSIVNVKNSRSVQALQSCGVIKARYSDEELKSGQIAAMERSGWRKVWFECVCNSLAPCDLIFADPDNGLPDDKEAHRTKKYFSKRIPLSEVHALSSGRTAIIYHHNTRYKGGHDMEVDYWCGQIRRPVMAIRANAYSCRTFFIVNPDTVIAERVKSFCERWSGHNVRLHRDAPQVITS